MSNLKEPVSVRIAVYRQVAVSCEIFQFNFVKISTKSSPVELASEMDVVINISSPAGFSSFVVDIKSPVLEALNVTSIDFIDTSSNSPMVGMVLPEILGDQDIATATELSLDLSKLVPLIITVGSLNGTLTPDSNHIFTLNITDKEGNDFSQALTFHYTGENTAE